MYIFSHFDVFFLTIFPKMGCKVKIIFLKNSTF